MFLASGADIVGGFSDIGNGFKNRKPQPVATVPLVFLLAAVRSQKKIAGTVIRITYRESRLKGAISAHRLSFERPLSDGKTPAPELSNRLCWPFVKDGAMRR